MQEETRKTKRIKWGEVVTRERERERERGGGGSF